MELNVKTASSRMAYLGIVVLFALSNIDQVRADEHAADQPPPNVKVINSISAPTHHSSSSGVGQETPSPSVFKSDTTTSGGVRAVGAGNGKTVTTTSAPVAAAVPEASVVPIAANEKASLLDEFKKAKSNVDRALKHQEQAQFKELQTAQSVQAKVWREKERKARRDFFAGHETGPERRKYIQDYLPKKKQFDQSLKDDYAAKKKEWADKVEASKKKIAEQEVQFKAQLEKNVRPGDELWPHAQ